ncbi:hypothetical protein AB834_03130 [PVC group bacterium (ex Bugula neritina AB1)]|nr:hypothetical protein AB834_03130 [PVC group bacterium (ex Bugula neritina AB1)]
MFLIKEENYYLFETKTGKQQYRKYPHLKKVTPHTFRHSFATSKIAKTGKIKAVRQYLGHSSSSVTLDMYTHQELSTTELFT